MTSDVRYYALIIESWPTSSTSRRSTVNYYIRSASRFRTVHWHRIRCLCYRMSCYRGEFVKNRFQLGPVRLQLDAIIEGWAANTFSLRPEKCCSASRKKTRRLKIYAKVTAEENCEKENYKKKKRARSGRSRQTPKYCVLWQAFKISNLKRNVQMVNLSRARVSPTNCFRELPRLNPVGLYKFMLLNSIFYYNYNHIFRFHNRIPQWMQAATGQAA